MHFHKKTVWSKEIWRQQAAFINGIKTETGGYYVQDQRCTKCGKIWTRRLTY